MESASETKAEPRRSTDPYHTDYPTPHAPRDVKGKRTFKKGQNVSDVTEVKLENEKLIDKVTTLEIKVIEKVSI